MKKMWVCFFLSLLGQILIAQERVVSGIVISAEDGQPMIGVTVIDKQSQKGVITDFAGEFLLTIPNQVKTLQVSYIGYKTKEVPVKGSKMQIVVEPDLVSTVEVMVVADGTGKKSTFTGSASVVKKESLEKIKASNVTQALQGQSSGVQVINSSGEPGANATILIRGIIAFCNDFIIISITNDIFQIIFILVYFFFFRISIFTI